MCEQGGDDLFVRVLLDEVAGVGHPRDHGVREGSEPQVLEHLLPTGATALAALALLCSAWVWSA